MIVQNYRRKVRIFLFLCLLCIGVSFLNEMRDDVIKNRFMSTLDSHAPNRTKIICTWNMFWRDPYFAFGEGSDVFKSNDCPVNDCHMIHYNSNKFVDKCDAVLFHLPQIQDRPKKRSRHQRYVFMSVEPPQKYPTKEDFKDFFNWTMTYRLDSDILRCYFSFFDLKTGEIISPSESPKWIPVTYNKNNTNVRYLLKTKRKPVAWFVSDCDTPNKRKCKVQELMRYIKVDVYGKCGRLECSRHEEKQCYKMLETDYFFYLSYENSNCVDYVSEKMLNGFRNNLVPIYYGGADVSHFVPPHSYIDARGMKAKDLARKLKRLINNPEEYLEYFWWKDYYEIGGKNSFMHNSYCKLCEMLHDSSLPEKVYGNMYEWWHMHRGLPACDASLSRKFCVRNL